MEKGDLIVGKVIINPIDNRLTPCIELILFDGLAEDEWVLLEVKNKGYLKEKNERT